MHHKLADFLRRCDGTELSPKLSYLGGREISDSVDRQHGLNASTDHGRNLGEGVFHGNQ